jgi:hypothetical protein
LDLELPAQAEAKEEAVPLPDARLLRTALVASRLRTM